MPSCLFPSVKMKQMEKANKELVYVVRTCTAILEVGYIKEKQKTTPQSLSHVHDTLPGRLPYLIISRLMKFAIVKLTYEKSKHKSQKSKGNKVENYAIMGFYFGLFYRQENKTIFRG